METPVGFFHQMGLVYVFWTVGGALGCQQVDALFFRCLSAQPIIRRLQTTSVGSEIPV
jgi:hypothetical protein